MPLPFERCQMILQVTVWSLWGNFFWMGYKQAPCLATFLTLLGMALARFLCSLSSLNVSNFLQGWMNAC